MLCRFQWVLYSLNLHYIGNLFVNTIYKFAFRKTTTPKDRLGGKTSWSDVIKINSFTVFMHVSLKTADLASLPPLFLRH